MRNSCCRSFLALLFCSLSPALHAAMPPDAEPVERSRAGAPGAEVRAAVSRISGNDMLIRLHRAATGSSPQAVPTVVEPAVRCCEVSRATR